MPRHAQCLPSSERSASGADVVHAIVEELIEANVDLRRVSLDEMKRRLMHALRTRRRIDCLTAT